MLAWTKIMGNNDCIAETIINGHYESFGGLTEIAAFSHLYDYILKTYNIEVTWENIPTVI